MNIKHVFVSVNAMDFEGQSAWWSRLLDRPWDREPMPSCHEWDLTNSVLFQVLDNPKGGRTAVELLIEDLDGEIARLRNSGLTIEDPAKIDGFETLRYASFSDPEGNPVGLLEGH